MNIYYNNSHYDEGKVGKMLYLLWNNILEFGLNESLTQNNYKERIEEMSDLLINFTAKWSFEKMVNFLLNLYEPPKKVFIFNFFSIIY